MYRVILLCLAELDTRGAELSPLQTKLLENSNKRTRTRNPVNTNHRQTEHENPPFNHVLQQDTSNASARH